jgi:hypothetical protein
MRAAMSQSQPPLIHTARHHDRDHAALLQRGRFDKALEAAKALAPYFSQKFAPTDQPAVPHLEQGLPLFANQPNAGRSAPGQKGTRPPRRRARRRGNRMGRCRAHPRPPSAALRVIGRLISNDRHIRVNTLSPGPPTTPGLVGLAGDDQAAQRSARRPRIGWPLGRIADPDEIGKRGTLPCL